MDHLPEYPVIIITIDYRCILGANRVDCRCDLDTFK